jgi:hypothetical protein
LLDLLVDFYVATYLHATGAREQYATLLLKLLLLLLLHHYLLLY